MDDSKKKGAAVLVVVVIAAVIGLPYLNWFRFEMDVRKSFSDKGLGRFPTPQGMIAMPAKLEALAKARGFKTLTVAPHLEERGEGPTKFFYFGATMNSGSHAFKIERRVETAISVELIEQLSEGGIPFRKG